MNYGGMVKLSVLLTFLLGTTASIAQDEASRRVLPIPDPVFTGKVGKTPDESVAAWPPQVEAPAGAPNILLIMTDDVGFGAASTFGGPIPTPNLDRLAQQGLRYNRFHTTAMCSPTRAALLTGRNPHKVGYGMLADSAKGYPGYNGVMPRSAANIAKILGGNGYSTAMFGKHHNVVNTRISLAGPFDYWPTGLGFDYFFGFIAGDTYKWSPNLIRNVSPVPEPAPEGELLGKRLVDDTIRWIHDQKAGSPDRPFFVYFADPTLHAPHHAPADWIARFKGKFDQGWDAMRKETLARQIKGGIVPKGAGLSARPKEFPAWESLSAEDKAYQARLMEVAAAELSYEDQQLGRIIDELERMGQRDNTLIIFIQGDNGASGDQGPDGTTNEMAFASRGIPNTPEELRHAMPDFGGPKSYENYSAAWGWAMNTPFPWLKTVSSHLGGISDGMVISWPKRISAHGVIRSQFADVVDIAPTLLAAAHLPAPDTVDGIKQIAFDGIDLTPTFDSKAEQPRTQYFELMGNIGIYSNGWFANTNLRRMPWIKILPPEIEAQPRQWELYDLEHDFSQSQNAAAKFPDKLKELQGIFDAEAARNQVYPITEALVPKGYGKALAPVKRKTYDYWAAGTTVLQGGFPEIAGRSFSVAADITTKESTSGVILALGSRFAGWSFFLDQGKPVAIHALSEVPGDETRIAASKALTPGHHRVRFAFTSQGGPYAGGRLRIEADGAPDGEGQVARTFLVPAGLDESLDIGRDTGAPVTDYRTPQGTFEGTIEHVQVNLEDGKKAD